MSKTYNKRYMPTNKYIAKAKAVANSAAGHYKRGQASGVQKVLDAIQNTGKEFVPKGTFNTVGKDLGGFLGPVGSEVGGWAGNQLANIFGFGDYKVGRGRGGAGGGGKPIQGVPKFRSSSSDHIVTHREYIGDVTTGPASTVNGATPFQSSTYPIQPGLPQTFPWLNNVAVNFQEYEIIGMIFEYVSLSAEALNSTNTALGSVILSTQYDSALGSYTNKLQQENSEFCQSGRPSQNIIHAIECREKDNVLKRLYTRGGAPPSNYDLRLYDFALFQLSCVGMQSANTVIGELWVSYKIRFLKPLLQAGLYNIQTANYYVASSTIAGSTPFGTATWTARPNNYMPLVFNTNGLSFTMPQYIAQGNYLLTIAWFGSAVTWVPPVVTVTNGTLVDYQTGGIGPNGYEIVAPFSGALVSTYACIQECITVNALGSLLCTITLGAAGTVPTGATAVCTVIMTPYNANMNS